MTMGLQRGAANSPVDAYKGAIDAMDRTNHDGSEGPLNNRHGEDHQDHRGRLHASHFQYFALFIANYA
jgi:hypothetical protein